MAEKKNAKKLPLFWVIYLVCIGAAVLLLILAMGYVRTLLKEYEEVQPERLAKAVFSQKYADFSYASLLDEETAERFRAEAGYDTVDEMTAQLDSLLSGTEISFCRTSEDFQTGSITYTVLSDSRRVASFRLDKKKEKTEHGFEQYEEGAFTLYNLITSVKEQGETKPDEVYYVYLVQAPSDVNVKIEGGRAGEKIEERSYYRTDLLSSAKAGFEGVPYTEYRVIAAAPPTVTGTDPAGKAVSAEYSEANRTFSFPFTWNEGVKEALSDYCVEVAQKFEMFSQHGASLDSIKKYFDQSTPLYQQILDLYADMWMVIKFDNCEFEEIGTSEYYAYSENEVSMRVSMVWIGHRSGKDDSTDNLDYTFVFKKENGKWLVTEAYNN